MSANFAQGKLGSDRYQPLTSSLRRHQENTLKGLSIMADLLDYIDFKEVEALNAHPSHNIANALKQVRAYF
jgi:hypothetical protein